MKLRRVINLFGGPSTGKSTIAAGLFYDLKRLGSSVEMVHEYAKELTYEKRGLVLTQDQLYIFAKQHRKLFRIRDEVDYAICDSPLLLPAIYYSVHKDQIYNKDLFNDLVISTFNKYPNINIFLERNPAFNYEDHGREQDEDQSKEIDNLMLSFLEKEGIDFKKILSDNYTVHKILTTF